MSIYENLNITKDTLEFLLESNLPDFELNEQIKNVIEFVKDEIEQC